MSYPSNAPTEEMPGIEVSDQKRERQEIPVFVQEDKPDWMLQPFEVPQTMECLTYGCTNQAGFTVGFCPDCLEKK